MIIKQVLILIIIMMNLKNTKSVGGLGGLSGLSGKNDESPGPSLFKNDDLLDDEAYMRHLHKVEDSAIYPKFKSFCSEINSSKVCHRVEKFKILPREYDICEESISIHIRFLACDLQSNCAYKAQYAYINLNQKTFNITKFLSAQQKYL